MNNGPMTIENYGGPDSMNPTIHDENFIPQKAKADKFNNTQKVKKLDLGNIQ